MAILLRKIEQELADSSTTSLRWHLIRILHLNPSVVQDPEHAESLLFALCLAQVRAQDSFFRLIAEARQDLEALFLKSPSPSHRPPILKTITSNLEDPPLLAASMLRLCPYSGRQDLSLARQFLRHQDGRVRAAAIELFIRSTPIEELGGILPWICDPLPLVSHHAAFMLSRYPLDVILRTLRSMASAREPGRRRAALMTLSRLEPTPEIEGLMVTISRDPVPQIRMEAIEILKTRNVEIARKRLEELSRDMDIDVCEKATQALEEFGSSPPRNFVKIARPLRLYSKET